MMKTLNNNHCIMIVVVFYMLVLIEDNSIRMVSSFLIVPRTLLLGNDSTRCRCQDDYKHNNCRNNQPSEKKKNHDCIRSHTIIQTFRYLDSCRMCQSSKTTTNTNNEEEYSYYWTSRQDVEMEAKKLNVSIEDYMDWNVRVTVYGNDHHDDGLLDPILFQIKRQDKQQQNDSIQTQYSQLEELSNTVTNNTIRWCQDFVAKLNLCPWAKSSISTPDAIRIKIVPQSAGWNFMEQVIYSSSYELIRVTTPTLTNNKDDDDGNCNSKMVDPNVAITFIVVAPDSSTVVSNTINGGGGWETNDDFEFLTFYQHFMNLEDTLFQEADDAASQRNDDDNNDDDDDLTLEQLLLFNHNNGCDDNNNNILLGDHITVAPFHPDWTFSSSQQQQQQTSPLDFEKQTPYPTISLVRSSAVMSAGEETTNRIGNHNEQILNDLGIDTLKTFYHQNVYQKDSK